VSSSVRATWGWRDRTYAANVTYSSWTRTSLLAVGCSAPPANASFSATVQGDICSVTGARDGAQDLLVVAFCGAPFLSYALLTPCASGAFTARSWVGEQVSFHILSGQPTSGWRDGFASHAMYGTELYLSADFADPAIVYVLDTVNCLLREVLVDVVPDPYLTQVKSNLYGLTSTLEMVSEPRCYGAGSLNKPRQWFPLPDLGLLLFLDDQTLYQLDPATRDVTPVLTQADADWALPAVAQVRATTTQEVELLYGTSWYRFQATHEGCPTGYTSLQGASCTQPCDASHYVDPLDGLCKACSIDQTCAAGYEWVACTSKANAHCQPCGAAGVRTDCVAEFPSYARGYRLPGVCSCENIQYRPPRCPPGYWGSVGDAWCTPCPLLSTTSSDGAEDAGQCKCLTDQFSKTPTGACQLTGRPFPLLAPSSCPFEQYSRGGLEACANCAVDPCPVCGVGYYPASGLVGGDGLAACSCQACQGPTFAAFTSAGVTLNLPTSCLWQCRVGYYRTSTATTLDGACLACQNLVANAHYISSGALNSPSSCEWDCDAGFRQTSVGCAL